MRLSEYDVDSGVVVNTRSSSGIGQVTTERFVAVGVAEKLRVGDIGLLGGQVQKRRRGVSPAADVDIDP